MAGANYMGGKRSAARARRKDATGHVEKRHFGKQRLISALRKTSDHREPTKTGLSFVLPELSLAHATQAVHLTQSSHLRNSQRRLTPPDPQTRSSRILAALDTFDHMTIRAAIGRILQRPNLVGVQTCIQTVCPDTAEKHRGRDAMDVASPISDESDAYHQNSINYRSQDNVVNWHVDDDQAMEAHPNNDHSSFSRFKSHAYAQRRSYSPLPRSSPFSTDSQTTDHMILDFDTSPRRHSHSITESSDDQANISAACKFDTTSLPECLTLVTRSEHQNSEFSGAGVRAMSFRRCQRNSNSPCSSPSQSVSHKSMFSQCPFPTPAIFTPRQHDVCEIPNVAHDFLADPDPWMTIGKILQLDDSQPIASQMCSDEQLVDFTQGREGVGYTRWDDSSASPNPSQDIAELKSVVRSDQCIDCTGSDITGSCEDVRSEIAANHQFPETAIFSGMPNTYHRNMETAFSGPCLFGDSDLEDE